MPGINLRVVEAPDMAGPYHGGETYRGTGDKRNESTSSDSNPDSHFSIDSEDENNIDSDTPNIGMTESKSEVQLLEDISDGLASVVQQKLSEVTVRLEAYCISANTTSCGDAYEEAIKRLREIGSVARSLPDGARNVATYLIFKRNNPGYPIYPLYPEPTHIHAPHLSPLHLSPMPNQNLNANTNIIPNQGLVEINLHGLHISEAKRFIDYHLDLCSTQSTQPKLTRTEIICGWGKHSKHNPGGGTLKKALKEYLDGRGVKCEEVPRNRGRLCVYFGADVDNVDSDKHMREVDDEGTSTSVDISMSTACTPRPSNIPTPQSNYNSESESLSVNKFRFEYTMGCPFE